MSNHETKLDKLDVNISSALNYLMSYVNTYPDPTRHKNYSNRTYINDILYGVGSGLNKEYVGAEGFVQFRIDLLKFLLADEQISESLVEMLVESLDK